MASPPRIFWLVAKGLHVTTNRCFTVYIALERIAAVCTRDMTAVGEARFCNKAGLRAEQFNIAMPITGVPKLDELASGRRDRMLA